MARRTARVLALQDRSVSIPSRSLALLAIAAAGVAGLAGAAFADTTVSQWTGVTDTTWSTAGNWAGAVPSSTVGALFDSTFTNMPNLTAGQTSMGLWLKTGVGQDVTINSSVAQTLNLSTGATLNGLVGSGAYNAGTAILMDDSANHNLTFGPNITLTFGSNTTIYNNSNGTLLVQGKLQNPNGVGVQIAGTSGSTLEIAGSLVASGGGSVYVNTSGTVILSGDSSAYTKVLTLAAGTLRETNVNALKSASLSVAGGTLQLRSDTDGDTFTASGTTNVTGSSSIINVDRLTAGGATGNTLKLGAMTAGNATKVNVTGGNGYNLATGTITAGNGYASTVTLNPTTANLSVAGITSLNMSNGNQTIALDGTSSGNSVAGPIANSATGGNYAIVLQKNNTSTWTLAGANTYTGTTTISNGTLRGTHNNALGFGGQARINDTGAVSIGGSGAVLDMAGVTFNKPVTLNTGSLINGTSATTTILDSGVSSITFTNGGSGFSSSDLGHALTISGTGTGAAANISSLSASSGTISNIIGTGTGWVTGNTITLTGGGATQNAMYTVTATGGQITALALTTPGFGYTGAPTGFTGAKGSASPAFTGSGLTPTYNNDFAVGAITTTAAGSGYTAAPTVSISGVSGSGLVASAQYSRLTLTGTANNLGGAGDLTINGVVSGTGGFTKTGNGTLTLTGANTYSGTTTLSLGTLLVNNTTGSATGTGALNVNSGATLGGSGIISGPVNILAGAYIAPGNSPGILKTGNLSISGTLLAQANGPAAGTGYDQLDVTGTVTLGAASALNFTLGALPGDGASYTIINNDAADAMSGTFAQINGATPTLVSGSTYSFPVSYNSQNMTFLINYAGGDGNDAVITAVVPEPATATLAAITIGGVCLLRKRQR